MLRRPLGCRSKGRCKRTDLWRFREDSGPIARTDRSRVESPGPRVGMLGPDLADGDQPGLSLAQVSCESCLESSLRPKFYGLDWAGITSKNVREKFRPKGSTSGGRVWSTELAVIVCTGISGSFKRFVVRFVSAWMSTSRRRSYAESLEKAQRTRKNAIVANRGLGETPWFLRLLCRTTNLNRCQ